MKVCDARLNIRRIGLGGEELSIVSIEVMVWGAEPVERPPYPSVGGSSRMLRGFVLRMGKLFWARACRCMTVVVL